MANPTDSALPWLGDVLDRLGTLCAVVPNGMKKIGGVDAGGEVRAIVNVKPFAARFQLSNNRCGPIGLSVSEPSYKYYNN